MEHKFDVISPHTEQPIAQVTAAGPADVDAAVSAARAAFDSGPWGRSEPADRINPTAVEAMREVGIDITGEQPKLLTTDSVEQADVVVTMGCGDTCPFFPGTRYLDWPLDDPGGQGIEAVRRIRDQIRHHVETLITELLPQASRA